MKIFDSIADAGLVEVLKAGEVGVVPTDTIYGLVCVASKPESVARLYGLKHREHKPGTVIAASIDQIAELGIKKRYLKAVEQFWPGAISIEIPHTVDYLSQGTGRQAFRIPDEAPLRALLEKTGPLQTTSANDPGETPAVDLADAQRYFGDKVDFYVEGGNLAHKKPSTIIKVVDDAIEVIRQGAVDIDPKYLSS